MQVNKLNPFGNNVWSSDIQCCFCVWVSLNWSCVFYVHEITRNRESNWLSHATLFYNSVHLQKALTFCLLRIKFLFWQISSSANLVILVPSYFTISFTNVWPTPLCSCASFIPDLRFSSLLHIFIPQTVCRQQISWYPSFSSFPVWKGIRVVHTLSGNGSIVSWILY